MIGGKDAKRRVQWKAERRTPNAERPIKAVLQSIVSGLRWDNNASIRVTDLTLARFPYRAEAGHSRDGRASAEHLGMNFPSPMICSRRLAHARPRVL